MRNVPLAPQGPVYIVLDDFGEIGRAYRETDVERSDLESLLIDLTTDQFSDPVAVYAFDPDQGWSQDVTQDVVDELRLKIQIEGLEPTEKLQAFLDEHRSRQPLLPLRLART